MLKAVMDSLDDVDEAYKVLYTERDGKFELTGIDGIKTANDVQRVQTALSKERDLSAELKSKLSVWGDLDHADVMSKLDRIPGLEAASKGNLDQEKIDEMVAKQVESQLLTRTNPLQRTIDSLKKQSEADTAELSILRKEKTDRIIGDVLEQVASESGMLPSAISDFKMLGERVLEVVDDQVIVKSGTPYVEGSDAQTLLHAIKVGNQKTHWWPESKGGGATGGKGIGAIPNNPWSKENWNRTNQAKYIIEHGSDKASSAAKAAGTSINGGKPT